MCNWFRKQVVGTRSNDGVLYTEEQWQYAIGLVQGYYKAKGLQDFEVSVKRWEVTGAVCGTVRGKDFEYYMRDLVRGKIRDDVSAFLEYKEQVRKAGIV
jgi:hypothetical protein